LDALRLQPMPALLTSLASVVGPRRVRLQRRDFLKSAVVGVATGGLGAPAIAQSRSEIRWRLACGFETSQGATSSGVELFANQVAALTDGSFAIEPLTGSAAQRDRQAFDAVAGGSLEMAHAASSDCFAKDPTFAIASSIPFGLNARQRLAWLLQGGGNEAFNAFYAKHNVYGLPMGNGGATPGGWYRRRVKSLDALAGLKVGARGLAGQVMARLGVAPQELAPADAYAALESGAIDGFECDGSYDDERLPFAKVAPNFYAPALTDGGAGLHLFINLDKWNNLPNAYRSAIANAAVYANSWMQARTDATTPATLKGLVARGARLRSFPRDVLAATERAAMQLYADISAQNADFKTMIELMMAFRNDAFLWWQVAEYSDDSLPPRPPGTSL
jgi:TRAP-type mannitol/chloroaromatic compound transport system substrate-binding protein